MLPKALEGTRPLVEGTNGVSIGAIEDPTAITTRMHQADIAQHTQVLRDGGLLEAQCDHDIANGALLRGEVVEDFAAAWLSDGVKGIGSGGGARHAPRLHSHIGICQDGVTTMSKSVWGNPREGQSNLGLPVASYEADKAGLSGFSTDMRFRTRR